MRRRSAGYSARWTLYTLQADPVTLNRSSERRLDARVKHCSNVGPLAYRDASNDTTRMFEGR